MINKTLGQIQRMVKGKNLEEKYGDIEIKGVSIDTRTLLPGQLFIPIVGENLDGHKFIKKAIEKQARAVLWDSKKSLPDEDIPLIIVEDTTKALQLLAKNYLKNLDTKVIGITGSNGKTSTKDILYSIIKSKYKTHKTIGNYNNEFGMPLTVLSMDEDIEVAVVEMGMAGLGDIELLCNIGPPDIGIITNSTDVHINDLATVENILKAKMEMAEGIKEGGILVYLGDSPPLKKAVENTKRNIKKISFGEREYNDFVVRFIDSSNKDINFVLGIREEEEYTLGMLGRHNIFNGAAAIAAAYELGFTYPEIKQNLYNIDSTGLRSELIKGENFDILNDAYKSNPISLYSALDTIYSLDNYSQKILVLGDMFGTGEDEICNHIKIGEDIDSTKIDYLFTLGDLGEYFGEGAKKNFPKDRIYHFKEKSKLVESLKSKIKKNAVILIKGSRILEMEEIGEKLFK